ncbi:hypothetical protein NLC35_03175 [Candidatus Aminicenantes bacterium AC-334-K16]|jgi:hypothetical protein|nr:hypothetical protein [Candidatus Aminicenantes bacterium AC-334-K16]
MGRKIFCLIFWLFLIWGLEGLAEPLNRIKMVHLDSSGRYLGYGRSVMDPPKIFASKEHIMIFYLQPKESGSLPGKSRKVYQVDLYRNYE